MLYGLDFTFIETFEFMASVVHRFEFPDNEYLHIRAAKLQHIQKSIENI